MKIKIGIDLDGVLADFFTAFIARVAIGFPNLMIPYLHWKDLVSPRRYDLTDIMTVSANLAGIPAITIPAGLVDNLPSGVQLMAPQNKDKFLLSIAQKVEDII